MATHNGKIIWIIGASSGIGRALAVELANQGAKLVLSARSADKLNALNQQLGGGHQVIPLDVGDHKALTEAANRFSALDSVIFMSAIYEPTPIHKMNITDAHQLVNINLNGALNTIHATLPLLKQQAKGQLVLCGSVAGYCGLPNGQPYSATKAALINLAESLRTEEPELDIKLINPGFVRTDLTDKNKFNMPMMIEADQAAKIIAKGLLSNRFEIHFPKKFTYLVKLIANLPYWLYFKSLPRS